LGRRRQRGELMEAPSGRGPAAWKSWPPGCRRIGRRAAKEVIVVIDLGGGWALCVRVRVGGRGAESGAHDRVKSHYFRRLGVVR
jgi:hypothetical protein